MKNIDALIKTYYQQQSLPDTRLDAILAQASKNKTATSLLLQVAVIGTVLILGTLLLQRYFAVREVTDLAVTEIAMNHEKHLAMETISADYAVVGRQLAKLDFALRAPVGLDNELVLLGGRYCSIQGQLAAQLKLRDDNLGQVHTLFITPIGERLADIGEQQLLYKNVAVKLWQESDLFFALASDRVD